MLPASGFPWEQWSPALAETAALLVLQGKMQALWEKEDAPTRQTSDEPSSPPSRKPKKRGRH